MNIRVFIIASAIALPVLLIAIFSKPGTPKPATAQAEHSAPAPQNQNKPPPATLAEAKERAQARLAQLDGMTQAQWEAEPVHHKAANLEGAKQLTQQRLDQLNAMTEADWSAQHRPRRPAQSAGRPRAWEEMSPDQQLMQALKRQQELKKQQ